MTYVRRPLVALIALYGGAVTLDRIGLARSGAEAIDSYVYLIAGGIVLGIFAVPLMRRTGAWPPAGLAITTMAAIGIASGEPLAGLDPYAALTEAAFVVLTTVLAHRAAIGLEAGDAG